jgi:hypothetical protein
MGRYISLSSSSLSLCLPSTNFRYYGKWDHGKRLDVEDRTARMTYREGGSYKGQFKDERETGTGMKFYPNGDLYEGAMVDGKRSGQGTMLYESIGERWVGPWLSDRREGQGVLQLRDGNKLQGLWSGDKLANAPTTVKFPSHNVYTGTLLDNCTPGKNSDFIMHGFGKLMYRNGGYQEGTWVKGVLHGHGTELDDDNNKYVGDWTQGVKHGKGWSKRNSGMYCLPLTVCPRPTHGGQTSPYTRASGGVASGTARAAWSTATTTCTWASSRRTTGTGTACCSSPTVA